MFQKLMKKLYGRFNGKLFPIVAKPMAWFTMLFLLAYKKKNQKVILLGSAIGDVLYSLSFLETLITEHTKKGIDLIFISSERYRDTLSTYKVQPSKVIFLPHCGILHLFVVALACIPTHFQKSWVVEFAYKHGICPGIPGACPWYANSSIVGTRNLLSNLYGVPTTPISYHGVKKTEVTAIPDFYSKKDKICVVNPYSFSMNCPIDKFEGVCELLKREGYIVYTNVVGSQQAIKGTLLLNCGMDELFSIACDIPLFVSIRSGILDFLIPSQVNMFVVYVKYDMDDDFIIRHYSLHEWQPQGKIEEIIFDGEIDENILENTFKTYMERLSEEVK